MAFASRAPAALDQEEDGTNILLSADEGETLGQHTPQRRNRMHMLVALLAGGAFVAAAVIWTKRTTQTALVPLEFDASPDEIIEEAAGCGGPFEQCGGNGFAGAKCCKPGCVCEVKNAYFWKCSPAGSNGCDPAAAQGKADYFLRKAIPFQAKAYDDAKKKAAAARKAAEAAKKLAAASQKAAAVAEAEERAATEAFHAIQSGNGEKWVKAVYHQGGVAKKAKELSEAAATDFSTMEDAESSRALVATALIDALPKAEKFAGPEKQWTDNLADSAKWTMIGDDFKRLPDDSDGDSADGDSADGDSADGAAESSSDGDDSKLVGGVYYTR